MLEGRGREVGVLGARVVSRGRVGLVGLEPEFVRTVLLGQWHVRRFGGQSQRAVRDPEGERVSAQHADDCTLKTRFFISNSE